MFLPTMDNLFEKVSAVMPLSTEGLAEIRKITVTLWLPKGTLLIAEGQIQERLVFLHEGLARGFYYEDGVEVTSWMSSKDELISTASGFLQQKKSLESAHLLENSLVSIIVKKDWEESCRKFPEILLVLLIFLEQNRSTSEEMLRLLRLSAEERYKRYTNNFSHVVAKAKVQHLSSLLGLSRSCISLLRAKR